MEILSNIALIGQVKNEYVMKSLTESFNFMTLVYVDRDLVPSL